MNTRTSYREMLAEHAKDAAESGKYPQTEDAAKLGENPLAEATLAPFAEDAAESRNS